MSIAVTMRPRRLSTPAISGGASGTRVRRSGTNTSCTREIGRPNNWPPIITVTYSIRCSSAMRVVVMYRPHAASTNSTVVFLQRGDQALAVELGDEIVEAGLAAALDRRRRGDRRERDDRHMRAARVGADRLGKLEAVHAGHFDVGDDRVELSALLDQCERLVARGDRGDVVAGGLEHRHQHVAEEGRVVDEQERAGQRLGASSPCGGTSPRRRAAGSGRHR